MIFAFQAIKKNVSSRQNHEESFCLLLISSHQNGAISVKGKAYHSLFSLLFIPLFYYNFSDVSLFGFLYYVLELPETVSFNVKSFAVA